MNLKLLSMKFLINFLKIKLSKTPRRGLQERKVIEIALNTRLKYSISMLLHFQLTWIGSFLERILFIFQSLLNILTWNGLSIFWSLFNILACNCSFTTTDALSESDSTSFTSTTVLGLIVVSMVVVGSKALIVVFMVVVDSTAEKMNGDVVFQKPNLIQKLRNFWAPITLEHPKNAPDKIFFFLQNIYPW